MREYYHQGVTLGILQARFGSVGLGLDSLDLAHLVVTESINEGLSLSPRRLGYAFSLYTQMGNPFGLLARRVPEVILGSGLAIPKPSSAKAVIDVF